MSRFLLEAGMHSHAVSLKRESQKAAAVLWLARVVLRNPAYTDWLHRPDVRRLRRLLQTNRSAQEYYAHCRPGLLADSIDKQTHVMIRQQHPQVLRSNGHRVSPNASKTTSPYPDGLQQDNLDFPKISMDHDGWFSAIFLSRNQNFEGFQADVSIYI
ncbi:unnamed protein product [Protopolystoma xenopodis]|uniref:Uncharacterized protein n=1 Tax=Protopolystoma xenopodis TaxID=117903 RepID=A0A3S5FEC2_9PLAT|nr:unnamed protein product [Protopolystoma xenopodis]